METTFSKLWNALKPIEAWSKTVDFNTSEQNQWSNGPRGNGRQLRLDALVPEYSDEEQQIGLVWQQVRHELIDLITFGDMSNIGDALYKSLDGELKRNRGVVSINVPSAAMYREYKPTKSIYEYTVYLVLDLDYGD